MRIDEKTKPMEEIIISITLCPKIHTIVICQLKIKLKRNLSLIFNKKQSYFYPNESLKTIRQITKLKSLILSNSVVT